VPSDPLVDPVSLAIVDGVPTFAWCGDTTNPMHYMGIEYRTFDPDTDAISTAKGSDGFVLSRGLTFSVENPPTGLVFSSIESAAPTDASSMRLFLYAGGGADSITIMASFDIDDLSDLEEGQWLHPSGEETDLPCGNLR